MISNFQLQVEIFCDPSSQLRKNCPALIKITYRQFKKNSFRHIVTETSSFKN